MTIAVAYKWAANPQDASVGADGTVDWSRAKPAVSEYDPVAAQVGRTLADQTGAEIVGVSVGTRAVSGSMAKKAAMSRGFDRGVVVADDAVAGWNLTAVARALADLVRTIGDVDLLLTGDASIDENARMTSALVAGYLGWPCLQEVQAVEKTDSGWTATQSVSGGTRAVTVNGPAVIAVTADAAKTKVPGMKDILAAGKKKVAVAKAGTPPVSVELVERTRPETRSRKNKIVADADELVAVLRTDGVL